MLGPWLKVLIPMTAGQKKKNEQFEELTRRLQRERIKFMGHLLREDKQEPTRRATFVDNSTPNIGWKKRIGRPRNNWIEETMRETWQKHRKSLPYGMRKHKNKKRKFNIRDKKVRQGLYLGAKSRLF